MPLLECLFNLWGFKYKNQSLKTKGRFGGDWEEKERPHAVAKFKKTEKISFLSYFPCSRQTFLCRILSCVQEEDKLEKTAGKTTTSREMFMRRCLEKKTTDCLASDSESGMQSLMDVYRVFSFALLSQMYSNSYTHSMSVYSRNSLYLIFRSPDVTTLSSCPCFSESCEFFWISNISGIQDCHCCFSCTPNLVINVVEPSIISRLQRHHHENPCCCLWLWRYFRILRSLFLSFLREILCVWFFMPL